MVPDKPGRSVPSIRSLSNGWNGVDRWHHRAQAAENACLMEDGKWQRSAEYWRCAIFHLPFAIQKMLFSRPATGAAVTCR
jgi:hypothetical protein